MVTAEEPDIALRSRLPDGSLDKCGVITCPRPTQRAAGRGLSYGYCKNHIEHIRRHGHSWLKTPSKAAFAPYQAAARRWLKTHGGDMRVSGVVRTLDTMLENAGIPITAHRLRGQTLEARASNVLARNREAGKTGADLLLIVLALGAYIAENGPRGSPDYRYTQIAKLMHRVSSGNNRTSTGLPIRRKNPRPEGRFMVHLGRQIEDVAGIVADGEAVEEILETVANKSSYVRD